MAKTELTKQLERDLFGATNVQGIFGCLEVTIGWFGKERVDYMTMDTKGIWRCYEIKVSKSDFYSKAKKTFVGHYNYYCMTDELYEQVKHDIPSHIGVVRPYSYKPYKSNDKIHYNMNVLKKPKKQELKVDEKILKNSMIRSLNREVVKYMKSIDSK